MAVYQISRIQVRRGQSLQGTGIPQLASGEMAWAVDTQELYIGNGSVSEGAPFVGNTRLLSVNDISTYGNILSIGQYSYKVTDSTIQSGVSASAPVFRTLQQRFDDIVTSEDFGMVGDNSTDNAPMFQQAINTLFLNPSHQASSQTVAGAGARVVLQIAPGIYNISKTIYIPSYATIVGSGPEKTIFNYVPLTGDTSPMFQFVNDTSSPGIYNVTSGLQATNQPKYIQMNNFAINLPNGTNIGMQLDSVKDGIFENISIDSTTTNFTVYNTSNIGIVLNAFSAIVTCEHNVFNNVSIRNTTTAVYAQQDILNNTFNNFYIYDAQIGFSLGTGSLGGSVTGQQYGPQQTTINNSKFNKVRKQAVYLERGEFNIVTNCKMTDVGNNDQGPALPLYPQIYFKTVGNTVSNIVSDRADNLVTTNSNPYVPEISGNVYYQYSTVNSLAIGQINTAITLFRLPASTDQYGTPNGTISYDINYVYKSTVNSFSRTGNLYLAADINHSQISLSDDYNFAGSDSSDSIAQVLTFSAVYLAQDGSLYTAAAGQVATTIAIQYTNTLTNDSGVLNYSYTVNSHTT